ncbi:MAG: lipid-transfer protein, partial [Caulobacteraceae bacterium]
AIIAGVGMTRFWKAGSSPPYDQMALDAIREALSDAGLEYPDVQQAYAAYIYADSTAGQYVLYQLGMTGLPVVNVHNNCSSGSTALFLARQAVESGAVDCALAYGFEQMAPGAVAELYPDRPSPLGRFTALAREATGRDLPVALNAFAAAGLAHMHKYGTKLRTFAEIRAKASRHALTNPRAIFRSELSADDVLASPEILPGVMTRLMACPPSSGAAAAVVVSDRFAHRKALGAKVSIAAQSMVTDTPATFDGSDMTRVVGAAISREAARQVYEAAGLGPSEIRVVELHDCFAQNELLTYEALGLCGEGEAEDFALSGENSYGGRVVTNPSGGLLSKGHPLGATGLGQCFELTNQLRGSAGSGQVEGVRHALQHNIGLGGACVVSLYERL